MNVIIDGQKYVPFVEKGDSKILDLLFYADDIGETLTIREYFRRLLSTLWLEEEVFSGKRPFGNSGWTYSLIDALIDAKVIKAEVLDNDDGEVYNRIYDKKEVNAVIINLISTMCLGE